MDGGLPDGLFLVVAPRTCRRRWRRSDRCSENKHLTGTADYGAATPRYFRALGIPLVKGRLFDDRDQPDRPHVALVSESLARSRWPGEDPIGRTIEFGNMDGDLRPLTVVGIVGDTREYGPEQPPRPTMYVNLVQRPRFSTTVVMRSSADPRAVTAAARGVLRDLAPDVPPRFRTFDQIYAASLGSRRFNLILVGVFAGTALILAIGGIYGVMAYNVTRRRREIGVRIALGASSRDVMRAILGQGLATIAIGVGRRDPRRHRSDPRPPGDALRRHAERPGHVRRRGGPARRRRLARLLGAGAAWNPRRSRRGLEGPALIR